MAAGGPVPIYPAGDTFTITAPPGWQAYADRLGYDYGAVLPYIYPPLWAALTAPLTGALSVQAFQNTFVILNHLSLLGMLWLGWRMTGRGPLTAYLILGLFILATSPIGFTGIFQNQPQLIVGFLTLLAIERTRAGAPLAGGGVLGLAVALKVSPILILPALLVAGDARRVALGFAAVGGGLGLMSLVLAGWPLHATYLGILSTISGTAILSEIAYTFDALAAQFGPLETMEFFGDQRGWWVGEKSALWRGASLGLTLAAAALPVIAIRRGADVWIWPTALILLGLVGSIGWAFYYVAPLAFLPGLMRRLGTVRGAVTAIAMALPGSYLALPLARDSAVLPFADQALGVLTLAFTATVFAALAIRSRR